MGTPDVRSVVLAEETTALGFAALSSADARLVRDGSS